LHVRLRSSKTDQEARGAVKALPYGRDPITCPPCAFARWREVLHAFDTAPEGGTRRAVMRVLRRQAATPAAGGGGEQLPVEEAGEDGAVLHVCRTIRVPSGYQGVSGNAEGSSLISWEAAYRSLGRR
jgi:hypothetical protein